MTESYKDIPRTPISSAPSTINITGLWRIMRPVVDLEKCKKCTLCWKFCPDAAIELVDGMVRRVSKELGGDPTVIGTGGLIDIIAEHSSTIQHVDYLLTLKGLKLIYEKNT